MLKPFKTSSSTYSKPRFTLVKEIFLQWHCRQLRSEAEAKKTEDWQSLNDNYWTEINKKILNKKKEKPANKIILKDMNFHKRWQTYIAISQACDRVRFNKEDMISVTHHCAVRNELLLHAKLISMIKHGCFDDLKKRLYNDFL